MSNVMRSLMFVPANNNKLMESAIKTDADVILPDLEDSVILSHNKQIARDNIVKYAKSGSFNNYQVYPRVNDRESGEMLKDVTQCAVNGIDGFMYPKSKKGEDIYFFDRLLETLEYERNLPIGTFKIIPLIETTSAVLNASEICDSSKRVIAIAFGCEDYIADLQGENDESYSTLNVARSLIAMAARSQNVIPIDTVHINVHDLVSLKNNILIAKKLGFEGMLVLHPKELPIVHKYYTPSDIEIEEAKNIISSYEKAHIDGTGVSIINNKFIGPPLVRQAEIILRRIRNINKKIE